jgi:iron complex transport system ATP-binding protein
MSETTPVLTASGLTYLAGSATLVDGATLDLNAGELVGLLGANGAGKSTLVRLMSGELKPASGAITLGGRALTTFRAFELAQRRAVVPQATSLTFPFTVREVVLLGASVPGLADASSSTRRMAAESLARVNLSALADRLYIELSGGERQRVHIARALCQLAAARASDAGLKILFLDEPTSSLDLAHQRLVLGTIREEARHGTAVLAVLHDLNLASAYCDRLLMMHDGRLVAGGTPSEVMQDGILSAAYRCELFTNTVPHDGTPFVLPVTSRPPH